MKLLVWMIVLACIVVYLVLTRRPPPPPPVIFKARRRVHSPRKPRAFLVFLERCTRSFVVQGRWDSVLVLADAYRKGSFPLFRPNTDLALRLYKVASGCPDASISGTAQLKYIECRGDVMASEDQAGAEIPDAYALEVLRHAETTIVTHVRIPERPVASTTEVVPVVQQRHVITSDAQNVHDHGVTRSIHHVLRDMSTEKEDPYEKIIDYVLESDASASTKADALDVLDTLGTETHSTLGTSEREALNKVWSTIDAFDTETRKKDARDILIGQLASGVEGGSVVCSTGKIARIVGSLDGLTETPSIRPTWALREELGTMAAKIRDTGGDTDVFRREARRMYVDDLGMKPEIVDAIVDEYSVGFEE
jgi:hypothetical protein